MAGRSSRATELLVVLKQFWAYLGSTTDNLAPGQDPLFFLAREWRVWHDATPGLSGRLLALISPFSNAEQAEFIELLRCWSRERFGYLGEGTASMILHELCRLEEFQGWKQLEPYGRSGLKGTYTVTLDIDPSVRPSIRPVAVLLTRRPEGAEPGFRPHLCEFDSKPGSVWHALSSLLGGFVFWPFAGAFLLTVPVWSSAHWAFLALPGLAAAAVLWSGRLVPEWESGLLSAVVVSALAFVVVCLFSVGRELLHARRQGNRLRGATAAVLLGDADPERYLYVHGASYGVALYLSALRALYAAAPDGSWLANCVKRLECSSAHTAYSGGVRAAALVRDVGRVEEKADSQIQRILIRPMPRRNDPDAKLRVEGLPRFLPLLLITGGQFGPRHWLRMVVSVAALGVLLAGAINASLLLSQPVAPNITFSASGIGPAKHGKFDEAKIAFSNVGGRRFSVWVTSDFYMNRAAEIPVDSEGRGEISLPLERHPRSTTTDPYRTEIEIAYDRSFFLRPLAPVIVKRFSLRSLVADTPVSSPVE